MTIKSHGGIFGRNPTFNNVTVGGTLTVDQIVEKTGAAGITLDGVTLKDGNIVLQSGNGIDFSATSGTGTSELFDDYEEGTWTPVVSDAATGGNTGTPLTADGFYTKVGNLVTVQGRLVNIGTSGMTAGNDLFIQGLPFTVSNVSDVAYATGAVVLSIIVTTGSNSAVAFDNSNYVKIAENVSGTVPDFITVGELGASTADIYFTITYRAA